jgi:hypothetical protein
MEGSVLLAKHRSPFWVAANLYPWALARRAQSSLLMNAVDAARNSILRSSAGGGVGSNGRSGKQPLYLGTISAAWTQGNI